jgi:hypothetical protein
LFKNTAKAFVHQISNILFNKLATIQLKKLTLVKGFTESVLQIVYGIIFNLHIFLPVEKKFFIVFSFE